VSRISALVLVLLALQDAPGWKRVEPGLLLAYPADHGSHPEYRTEWWYVTGHLEDDRGARFGFQLTVFRRGMEPGGPRPGESPLRARDVYAGHLALTDVAAGETRFAERLARPSPLAGATLGALDVTLADWSLARGAGDELCLAAGDRTQGFALARALAPQKPLGLHGSGGYSAKGGAPGNASAYASWPRLAATGTLALDGGSRAVRGSAWFDHEFGTTVLPDGVVGWQWFGLQLDDGRELMLFVLRDAEGKATEASAASLIERDGRVRALARDAFTLEASATWTSARTGGVYPARWTLAIPSAELALELAPLVADCELVTTATTGIAYWEGPVAVTGSASGRGYAELTGYAGSLSGRF
jgi:predicted secreted hydrolase